jgi:hypothetical protein
MAIAVSRLLDDATVREQAAAGSAEVVRAFALDALVGRMDQLYRRLLASATQLQ